MLKYMLCLTRNDNQPSKCQNESKTYFQCRMDRYIETIQYNDISSFF